MRDVEPDLEKLQIDVIGRVFILFTLQTLLALLILFEAIKNYGSKNANQIVEWQASWIMMARLICGIVMHINLVGRVKQGMEMMKYSLNHYWKFTNWFFGFMAGFLQANVVLLIEMVNFVSIVTHFEIIDIVMKFMTLMIIMTFSNIFFIAYDEDDYKKIITHM